ncbi:tetratricopeptide repeat protein [Amylibacter sp.]|nr:tetratricopeptide repeat protein [Amylibacter sp.]
MKLSVDQTLLKAKSYVRKGEIEEAQKLYQAILTAVPNNEKAQAALTALHKVQASTDMQSPPQEIINQLLNLYNSGNLETVVKQASLLTEQYPNAFIIWNILGAANKGLGDLDKASQSFKKVTELNPNHTDGHNNLGITLKNQGKLDEAIEAFKKALSIKSDYAGAYNNMGNALQEQGKLDEAIASFKKALSLQPDNAKAYNNIGTTLQDQGKLDEAIASFNKALSLQPNYAEAYNNIGTALQEQGKLEEAITSYNKALSLKLNYADAYNNMGITLQEQGKLEEAIEAFNKALSLKPDYADAHNNIGTTLQEQGKFDEAIEAYTKALAIKPDYAEAYNNMGNALQEQGELDEAIVAYNKALSLKPDYAEAYTNMGLTYLCKGSLEEGFKFNEWRSRKRKRTVVPARAIFIWDGKQSLNNKRFVAYAEQGLGDMIQFCRYLPFLEKKGADVIFKVKPALHALLQTMDSDVTLSTTDADEGQIDFEAPLMSLPHLFKTHLKTIPSMNPYLYADHARTKTWGKRLHTEKFKIGICWQGNMAKIDVGRSFPLSLFEGISKAPNVELISLHKGEGEHQIKDISFNLTTLGADFDVGQDAFLDTAAVMMNCDLIITSDTAIAHLAGALGCQTWVALKHVPDWRWMLDRSDSPWYPTMTLYRQKNPGDWACVFEAINRNLSILID